MVVCTEESKFCASRKNGACLQDSRRAFSLSYTFAFSPSSHTLRFSKVAGTMIVFSKRLLLLSLAASLPGIIKAASITGWNLENVLVPSPEYIPEAAYKSIVYADDAKTITYGGVLWVESDVKEPGMKVVTDGSGNAVDQSCIMTSGVNPLDNTTKQCNDPFQTSKRVKVYSDDLGGPVDLVYDVSTDMATDDTYRFFLKYENLSPERMESFTLQLGTGIGDAFEESIDNDGLFFAKRDGTAAAPDLSYDPIDLEGLFAFGLFGDASTDLNQEYDGYFDPINRGTFTMTVQDEDEIKAFPISNNIASLYNGTIQSWIPKEIAPLGYTYDIDNDPATDPVLVADFDASGLGWENHRLCTDNITQNLIANGFLNNTNDECCVNVSDCPVAISDETINSWASNARFAVDTIEDFGNVNVNTHITVNDTFASANGNFTLRIIPTRDLNPPDPVAPWLPIISTTTTMTTAASDTTTTTVADATTPETTTTMTTTTPEATTPETTTPDATTLESTMPEETTLESTTLEATMEVTSATTDASTSSGRRRRLLFLRMRLPQQVVKKKQRLRPTSLIFQSLRVTLRFVR